MKRVVSIALILCLLPVALFAGGAQERADATTVVDVWTRNRHDKDLMVNQVEQFNQTIGKEKGIEINYQIYGDDFIDIYTIAFQSGSGPDIMNLDESIAEGVNKGVIQPLTSFDTENWVGSFPFNVDINNVTSYGGEVYSIPQFAFTMRMVYNKDLFAACGLDPEQPPRTYEDVVAYARTITEQSNGKKFGVALPFKWGEGFWAWAGTYTIGGGFGRKEFDYRNGKFDFSTLKPYTAMVKQLKDENSLFPGAEGLDNDTARAQFAEGNVGMMFAVSWDVAVFNDQFPVKIDMGITEVPVPEATGFKYKSELVSEGEWWLGSGIESSKEDAVWEVYKWLNSDEIVAMKYEAAKNIPVNPTIAAETTAPDVMGFAEFSDVTNNTVYPVVPSVSVEGDTYDIIFYNAVAGQYSIDEAVEKANAAYNAALQRAVADNEIDLADFQDADYSPALAQ
jgi:multiple sugar transport system substrate-binding protein